MTVNLFSDNIKSTRTIKIIIENSRDKGFDNIKVEYKAQQREFMEVSQLLDYITKIIIGGRKQL